MSEKKLPNGMKLVFAPGCFDSFEGTQEELDALVKEIEEGFMNGTFFEKAKPMTEEDLDELSDAQLEALEKLFNAVEDKGGNRTLN